MLIGGLKMKVDNISGDIFSFLVFVKNFWIYLLFCLIYNFYNIWRISIDYGVNFYVILLFNRYFFLYLCVKLWNYCWDCLDVLKCVVLFCLCLLEFWICCSWIIFFCFQVLVFLIMGCLGRFCCLCLMVWVLIFRWWFWLVSSVGLSCLLLVKFIISVGIFIGRVLFWLVCQVCQVLL